MCSVNFLSPFLITESLAALPGLCQSSLVPFYLVSLLLLSLSRLYSVSLNLLQVSLLSLAVFLKPLPILSCLPSLSQPFSSLLPFSLLSLPCLSPLSRCLSQNLSPVSLKSPQSPLALTHFPQERDSRVIGRRLDRQCFQKRNSMWRQRRARTP